MQHKCFVSVITAPLTTTQHPSPLLFDEGPSQVAAASFSGRVTESPPCPRNREQGKHLMWHIFRTESAMKNKIIKSLEQKNSREMTDRPGTASRVGHFGLGLIHSLLNVRPPPQQPAANGPKQDQGPPDSCPSSKTKSLSANCHKKERKGGESPKSLRPWFYWY